ncbi:hypothetical protein B0H21DRAFT_409040 [Amylocystis lapponica]|nr:hypothetical protein B0H21DRAFT_409040 [Amylocystis lapponica]
MAAITNGAQLFPQLLNTPPSLENLPNEVLHEILDHIRPLSKTLPKCFTPRIFYLKYAGVFVHSRCHCLCVRSQCTTALHIVGYCSTSERALETPERALFAPYRLDALTTFSTMMSTLIASPTMTSTSATSTTTTLTPAQLADLLMPWRICNRRQLKPLEKCKHLSSLTLLWSESKFPDFSAWPELHTLRLFLAECQRDIRLAAIGTWLQARSLLSPCVRRTMPPCWRCTYVT